MRYIAALPSTTAVAPPQPLWRGTEDVWKLVLNQGPSPRWVTRVSARRDFTGTHQWCASSALLPDAEYWYRNKGVTGTRDNCA